MKTIFGAIALTLAVPAIAQAVPVAASNADYSPCQAAQGQQDEKLRADDTRKSCPEMKKHHGKMHRRAKTEAERLTAEVNGNGHQGHNH